MKTYDNDDLFTMDEVIKALSVKSEQFEQELHLKRLERTYSQPKYELKGINPVVLPMQLRKVIPMCSTTKIEFHSNIEWLILKIYDSKVARLLYKVLTFIDKSRIDFIEGKVGTILLHKSNKNVAIVR